MSRGPSTKRKKSVSEMRRASALCCPTFSCPSPVRVPHFLFGHHLTPLSPTAVGGLTSFCCRSGSAPHTCPLHPPPPYLQGRQGTK